MKWKEVKWLMEERQRQEQGDEVEVEDEDSKKMYANNSSSTQLYWNVYEE